MGFYCYSGRLQRCESQHGVREVDRDSKLSEFSEPNNSDDEFQNYDSYFGDELSAVKSPVMEGDKSDVKSSHHDFEPQDVGNLTDSGFVVGDIGDINVGFNNHNIPLNNSKPEDGEYIPEIHMEKVNGNIPACNDGNSGPVVSPANIVAGDNQGTNSNIAINIVNNVQSNELPQGSDGASIVADSINCPINNVGPQCSTPHDGIICNVAVPMNVTLGNSIPVGSCFNFGPFPSTVPAGPDFVDVNSSPFVFGLAQSVGALASASRKRKRFSPIRQCPTVIRRKRR